MQYLRLLTSVISYMSMVRIAGKSVLEYYALNEECRERGHRSHDQSSPPPPMFPPACLADLALQMSSTRSRRHADCLLVSTTLILRRKIYYGAHLYSSLDTL